MLRKNFAHYKISLKDDTASLPIGGKKARGRTFQESFPLSNSQRPPLKHILDWIALQAEDIRQAINEMKANSATKVTLHARFPVGVASGGRYVHEVVAAGMPVDGMEIDV